MSHYYRSVYTAESTNGEIKRFLCSDLLPEPAARDTRRWSRKKPKILYWSSLFHEDGCILASFGFTFLWTETWPPGPIPTNVEHCIAFFSYFEKSLKNVHAAIPKGNIRYDQYTVPDTVAVENAFLAFFGTPNIRAIHGLFVEEQWTQNYPQYLSILLCALFPTGNSKSGGVYMTPGWLSPWSEFTPVPSHGSIFVYMVPPQNVMPVRVTPAWVTPVLVPGREFHSGTKSRNGIM